MHLVHNVDVMCMKAGERNGFHGLIKFFNMKKKLVSFVFMLYNFYKPVQVFGMLSLKEPTLSNPRLL